MSKLVKYRNQKNLTQEELAEKAGVSVRTIQRIEKGAELKGYTLKALARALELSEGDLKIDTSVSETETINYQLIKYINLSSVLGILFPPLNIVLPWITMKYTKQVNDLTKQIVSIQILYTVIALIFVFMMPFISKWFGLTKQLFLISLITSVIVNLFIIFRNTISLDTKQKLHFKLNFSII